MPLYAGLDTMQPSTGVERLAAALVTSIESGRSAPRPVVGAAAYRVDPVPVVPPCQAFFAPVESVPLADAVGRTSAELVAPYPPGIPVLAPGEEGRPPASRVTNLSGQYT